MEVVSKSDLLCNMLAKIHGYMEFGQNKVSRYDGRAKTSKRK